MVAIQFSKHLKRNTLSQNTTNTFRLLCHNCFYLPFNIDSALWSVPMGLFLSLFNTSTQTEILFLSNTCGLLLSCVCKHINMFSQCINTYLLFTYMYNVHMYIFGVILL